MRKLIQLLPIILALQVSAQTSGTTNLKEFEGIYKDDSGQNYIINPGEGFPHIMVMHTGETHMLRHKEANVFEFPSTLLNWDSLGGTIEFMKTKGRNNMLITYSGKKPYSAKNMALNSEELSLTLDNDLIISGDFIQPIEPKSNLVAVLLHGDGDNDRYDLYSYGMYLISEGYSVFAFDKRNVGKSKGPEVDGDGYAEISMEYASDATKIVRKLQSEYPEKRFGVLGISQGGYIGSIVSAKVPELAFYVNISGHVSIGWKQWRHFMISRIKRSGFEIKDVAEAEDYFKSFFEVGLRKTSFEQYSAKLIQYQEKGWFKMLDKRGLVKWKSEASAIRVVTRNSFDPSIEVKKVSAPTLGVFHEFDHSTPPDTPSIFLNSLLQSYSKDVSVRVFPNSNHGNWVVDSYYFDFSKITKQEPKLYYFITDWLSSL
jgi:pimeloyl-ACP methyl ester carboxylesterase